MRVVLVRVAVGILEVQAESRAGCRGFRQTALRAVSCRLQRFQAGTEQSRVCEVKADITARTFEKDEIG